MHEIKITINMSVLLWMATWRGWWRLSALRRRTLPPDTRRQITPAIPIHNKYNTIECVRCWWWCCAKRGDNGSGSGSGSILYHIVINKRGKQLDCRVVVVIVVKIYTLQQWLNNNSSSLEVLVIMVDTFSQCMHSGKERKGPRGEEERSSHHRLRRR